MISRNIVFFLSCFVVIAGGFISSYFLFETDSDKKDTSLELWSENEQLNWLRQCLSLGRNEETCDCMLNQLQILYPSYEKMNRDMKNNRTKFSQMMISAKESCK